MTPQPRVAVVGRRWQHGDVPAGDDHHPRHQQERGHVPVHRRPDGHDRERRGDVHGLHADDRGYRLCPDRERELREHDRRHVRGDLCACREGRRPSRSRRSAGRRRRSRRPARTGARLDTSSRPPRRTSSCPRPPAKASGCGRTSPRTARIGRSPSRFRRTRRRGPRSAPRPPTRPATRASSTGPRTTATTGVTFAGAADLGAATSPPGARGRPRAGVPAASRLHGVRCRAASASNDEITFTATARPNRAGAAAADRAVHRAAQVRLDVGRCRHRRAGRSRSARRPARRSSTWCFNVKGTWRLRVNLAPTSVNANSFPTDYQYYSVSIEPRAAGPTSERRGGTASHWVGDAPRTASAGPVAHDQRGGRLLAVAGWQI